MLRHLLCSTEYQLLSYIVVCTLRTPDILCIEIGRSSDKWKQLSSTPLTVHTYCMHNCTVQHMYLIGLQYEGTAISASASKTQALQTAVANMLHIFKVYVQSQCLPHLSCYGPNTKQERSCPTVHIPPFSLMTDPGRPHISYTTIDYNPTATYGILKVKVQYPMIHN